MPMRLATMFLLLASSAAARLPAAESKDTETELFDRLSRLSPRDASAHVDLADWCRVAGLSDRATELYRKAIAIDPDCEPARTALGYRRWGLRWVLPEEITKGARPKNPPRSAPAPAPSAPAAPAPAPTPPSPAPAVEAAPAGGSATGGLPPEPSSEGAETVRAEVVEEPGAEPAAPPPTDELEAKRAWAASAAAKIATTFVTDEDEDFLIHTTLPKASAELKAFKANLKAYKKTLGGVLGAKSSTRMWPGKLQFVLLKSVPEFERFAELVDGMPAVRNPEGAYSKDGHTVVVRPDTDILPRLLGTTALERFDGSSRHVGWWIVEGLGEWMFASSAPGQAQGYTRNAYVQAADVLKAEGQALRIFNLIDSAENPRRDAAKNRTLAYTLVDFLIQYRARGLAELVAALKSPKAPEPPASKDDMAAFYASYVSYQEDALTAAFRKPAGDLEEKWKLFIQARAEQLKAQQARMQEEKAQPTGRRNAPKAKQ